MGKRAVKERQEILDAEARIRHEGGCRPNHEMEGEAGYSAKILRGFIFYLGHRKALKVLNEGYILHVKEGFVTHPATEGNDSG